MPTQLQTLIAKMASVETLLQTQADSQAKVLKILEGNGTPGLVQRTATTETQVSELRTDVDKLGGSMEKMSAEITRVSGLVETVNNTVKSHTKDGNPEHETLVVMFRRDPLKFTLSGVIVVLVTLMGISSGFFEHLVTFFRTWGH